MQTIGATLKQIRQAKGFTQKEVYGNVISRSFAIRLESGRHDVTAEKLFMILDRLGVSANEFRFMQNDDQPTANQLARSQVMLAYDQQNFPLLSHLATRYGHSKNPAERRVAVMADILMLAFDRRDIAPTSAMDNLWQQLALTKTWTLQEIEFGSVILVLTVMKKTSLAATIRKYHLACARYVSAEADPFRVMDSRAAFDLVALQQLLNQRDYVAAKNFKQQLLTGYTEHLTNNGTLEQQLSLWLWESYFGNSTHADGLAQALRQLPASRFRLGISTLLSVWGKKATQFRAQRQS
ncbi:helix-turn-helix domain-containing protein [Levilactobacillus sp. N40-8-2]|uniref:helix-turn-helix domain-containing protein n=1 Tax=Levilactobacillus muriae TaxID=3238987 RepID=UPI0038B34792